MLDIAFAPLELPQSGALALLVVEGAAPSGLWAAADAACGGGIARALAAQEFTGKKGQSCTIAAPGAGLSRVVAIGLGDQGTLTPRRVEQAVGTALPGFWRDPALHIVAEGLAPELALAAAEGAVLRAYRFDKYRTKEKPEDKPKLGRVQVLTGAADQAQAAWPARQAVLRGVYLTRDLVSEPPNVLNPAEMARRCEALRDLGVEVEVLGPADLQRLGFGALLGVAQGSANEPRVVTMRWRGQADGPPVALIGKGVTFDSGGISIKPAAGMEDMKWDMAGAGAVVGAMAALAGRRARADVVGIVGLVENMPSGTAQRPGDVVRSYSGQTVEIINTDAEGRMVLADLLWWCQEQFKPCCMVDLATLTGAMVISLGHEFAGLFASCDDLAGQLLAASETSGDALWRMPLAEAFDKALKSEIADMKHTGPRPGGAISAAHFLKRFTNDVPWAHLDIAGTAWSNEGSGATPKGATGFGVRLLDQLVAAREE